ncbi:16671_t:CDS:2 [Dentiscutata erythropus]|uniref:16671_t:CDS:1 n=1 Tax=Dentiscutata erythropus TaxID=1348616 RepID=A0A9N8WHP4_9GLOM|nr:16671_t:CDS:2 [Dentiscutata erythropus]
MSKMKMFTFEMKKFEGWETALDPDTLCLLSILSFRKTKSDFTYDKQIEHLTISKFVSWIAESTTYEKWKKATSLLKNGLLKARFGVALLLIILLLLLKQQVQGDDVWMFWNNVKLEVDTMKLKQAEKNHSGSILTDGTVLPTPPQSNLTPPSGSDEVSIIGSILPDGIALLAPPQSNFTPPSDSNKVRVPSQIGSILPDGTVLPKPPSQPNFILASDSDEVSFSSSQMTFDDNEVLKKKETLSLVERATLRYGMSKVIDLSAHMQDWFSEIDIQHMVKDHVAVLTVPVLDEEVNTFIADVEKKGGPNKAYKYCLEKHTNSPTNSSCFDLSLICFYSLFEVKDDDDLLVCSEGYTEIDIIIKTCSYIMKGLRKASE